MRTLLDIDDDILHSVTELAARRGLSAGRVVSDLVRSALASETPVGLRNGVPVLPKRPAGVRRPTAETVNDLRDGDFAWEG